MRKSYLLVAIVAVLGSANASAATYADTMQKQKSGDDPIRSGFFPNVELNLGYDDNVRRTENNEASSATANIKPDLQWVGVQRKHTYRVMYKGDYAWFMSEQNENYDDHFLNGDAFFDHSPKLNSAFGLNYQRSHDTRGESGSANNSLRPDQWTNAGGQGEVLYGRRSAKAQVGLRAEYDQRRYINNDQEFRDYDRTQIIGTAYYNLGPKTQLLIEPSYEDRDYLRSAAPGLGEQDSETVRIYGGVKWDATAKTTGTFKLGYFDRNYTSNDFEDANGTAVSADITWKRKTYSIVNLRLNRDINDASQNGANSYVSTSMRLAWDHELTRLTGLQTGFSYTNDDYDVVREDDIYTAWLGFSYSLKRWVSIGVRYDYDRRNSSLAGNSYKDNRFTIGLRTSFN